MSRVRTNIKINGRGCWTLFDTGSRNTYIVTDLVYNLLLPTFPIDPPEKVALGGRTHSIAKAAYIVAFIEDKRIHTHARVVEQIGKDEDGNNIEVLFGALAMQEWGIRPLPDEERLDLSKYPEEFVEFSSVEVTLQL